MELVADSLNPVSMTLDHHGRIWLVEKHGVVRIIDIDGQMLPDPFITLPVDDFNERGLLGIALHPDMDNQPFVYLYCTVSNGGYNRVSMFTANGDVAVPGSEEVLIELDSLAGAVHNGGAMLFGLDGKLYIATGDGSLPPQPMDNMLGKILRLEANGLIPPDNPFYATTEGKYRSIWALGLRNPFTMVIDAETGKIFACDVGPATFEEVNEVLPGANFGWPFAVGIRENSGFPENYRNPL